MCVYSTIYPGEYNFTIGFQQQLKETKSTTWTVINIIRTISTFTLDQSDESQLMSFVVLGVVETVIETG